jgi:eukaryotic-like serine/threonine-protein kinase
MTGGVTELAPPAPPQGLMEGESPGTTIGPYKLLPRLGEGGMGVVYMAEQSKPVRRKVAIKIIKPGMDSSQVMARFEAERQALALMDHQNIARVLDAGATEHGRPYFVMELVHGVPITEFCDQAHLNPRERLELFIPVCQAIQHAHQKGVIHRDIKPSNVLVTLYDGKPVPKVIDFGVAKATDQQLTERTIFTRFGAIVGTLEYMSPEQAEMSALGVDTRSDVYSLGVLLYELLTGTTPLDRARSRDTGYADLLKRFREDEPPRPSTRLSGSKETLAAVSARRRTDPAKLEKLLRGELDWIVMKALEKDRSRRYETANGLARDVERYLRDEPVEAGPPSTKYRLGKFARKHRGALVTAGAFASLLVVAAAAAAYLAVRARAAEHRATTANAATHAALNRSEEARAEAEAAVQFLVAAFRKPDPAQEGRDVKVADVLDRAAASLEGEFAGAPRAKAKLLKALGQTYIGLGLAGRAVEVLAHACAVSDATLGAVDPESLAIQCELAGAYNAAGRHQDALALFKWTLQEQTAALGAHHPNTLRSQHGVGAALRFTGRSAEAIEQLEQVLKLRTKILGFQHTDTLQTRLVLANSLNDAGRLDEGIAQNTEVVRHSTTILGHDHPDTLRRIGDLAGSYQAAERWSEAVAVEEPLLPRMIMKLGPDHTNTLLVRNNLAECYRMTGRLDEAIASGEKTLSACAAKLGADHPLTINARDSVAEAHHDAGHTAKAVELHEQNVRISAMKLGNGHPYTLDNRHNLAATYDSGGRHGEAEPLWRDLLASCRKELDPTDRLIAKVLTGLGANCLSRGEATEAESLFRESLAIRDKSDPKAWTTFETRGFLGASLAAQGKTAAAEPLLRAGYDGMKARADKIPWAAQSRVAEARDRLSNLDRAVADDGQR